MINRFFAYLPRLVVFAAWVVFGMALMYTDIFGRIAAMSLLLIVMLQKELTVSKIGV